MKIAAVVLAAGQSRRMGRPKALLEWGKQTVLDHVAGLLAQVADPVIVVAGFGAAGIQERRGPWSVVVNPNPELGMLSSLKCGLRAVPSGAGAVLFTPVDYPAVTAETIGALARRAGAAPLAVPVYAGRRGHPVLISREILEEILALPEDARPSDAIRRHLDRAIMLEVNDRGVVEDIDDPETYQRLRPGGSGE